MTEAYDAVQGVLRGTTIHSATAFSWFGVRSLKLPARIRRTVGPDVTREYLRSVLASQLYTDFYCQGAANPARRMVGAFSGPARERFGRRLAAANVGRGGRAAGWTVRAVDGPDVVVERDGLSLWVPGDVLEPPGGSRAAGAAAALPMPNGAAGMYPGFYMAFGDTDLPRDGDLVRLYWNLVADGAEVLLRRATTGLNRAGLPFRVKVLDSPDRYLRCDAGVLYVRKADYPAVAELVADIYPDVAALLRHHTPAFTKVLAPGLGLAEDPGPGESFGQHRCRLLADGIIRAFERRGSTRDRLAVVAERFAEAGISLDAPYLNPGSTDGYDLPPIRRRHRPAAAAPTHGSPDRGAVPCDPQRLLHAARRIGQQFVDDAVWAGDRCNWVSFDPPEAKGTGASPGATYRALGPSLYSGTSGVALFLGELYAATGDDAVRRVAAGSLRQAFSVADAVPPEVRLGLFTGWTGIALAAVRVAALLGEPDLTREARALLDRMLSGGVDETDFDVIAGKAGAVLALLVLRDLLDEPALGGYAARLGDSLVDTAEASAAGLSWSSPAYPTVHNLNGFSHGAAGVATALLELYRVTGRERYRTCAEDAFRYERHWFDADESNWPNLLESGKDGPFPFMTAWCHGAPGIALSRMRAHAILGDETLYGAPYKELAVALQTTRESVATWLRSGTANYSLCHGLSGNADILLHAQRVLGSDFDDDLQVAHRVAAVGIGEYGEPGRPWPCLSTGEETLSLLGGVAGIGHFLLRLRDPAVPSALLIHSGGGAWT